MKCQLFENLQVNKLKLISCFTRDSHRRYKFAIVIKILNGLPTYLYAIKIDCIETIIVTYI